MVYCNLKGGLGNMLFQIAAAKAISLRKNTNCVFPNYYNHLHILNKDEIYNSSLKHAHEYVQFLDLNVQPIKNNIKIYQYPFEYTEFLPLEDAFCIDGFFQTEKYFMQFREEILKTIKITQSIENLIYEKYRFVYEKQCTSIHFRRGDYLKFSNHHPTQDLSYYYEAIKNVKNTELFVIFSDDIEWCKNNFKFKNTYFVENEKDYIELFVMSKCQNNIIANSSFSWWGAWLNNHEQKIVVGPSKWFGNNLSHLNTIDVIPESWIKI